MFENYKVYEIEYGGKKMTFETGKMCCLSNASILVRWGETVVLCNVTASKKPREGIDFFPLSVDFEEKLYSVGKIPVPSSSARRAPPTRRSSTPASSTAPSARSSPRTCATTARSS